jgi:hypothetical protein
MLDQTGSEGLRSIDRVVVDVVALLLVRCQRIVSAAEPREISV